MLKNFLKFLNELKDSPFNDLKESDLTNIERLVEVGKEFREERRKETLLRLILYISILLAIWVMFLITLNNKLQLQIDSRTINILAGGVVGALVGYLGIIVRYYWNSKKQEEKNENKKRNQTGHYQKISSKVE